MLLVLLGKRTKTAVSNAFQLDLRAKIEFIDKGEILIKSRSISSLTRFK